MSRWKLRTSQKTRSRRRVFARKRAQWLGVLFDRKYRNGKQLQIGLAVLAAVLHVFPVGWIVRVAIIRPSFQRRDVRVDRGEIPGDAILQARIFDVEFY